MRFTNKHLIIFLILAIFVSGCTQTQSAQIVNSPKTQASQDLTAVGTSFVSKVIDGDTLELETGERVRLLGINTPEKGQPYNQEAAEKLKQLVEGKSVQLEQDTNDKDQYGRLLRYVYVGKTFVNLELVKEGYASVYVVPPNRNHEAELRSAWSECLKNKINLCRPSDVYC